MEASAAANSETAIASRPAALSVLRGQLLAMDVWIIGFMLLVIGWALLGLVVPGARLYPYEPRYAWAELPAWSLIGQFSLVLGVYLLAQRFGVHYHRHYASTGAKAPNWLRVANVIYVFIPILLIPLVFNLLGAFIAGVSGVPGIQTHPSFDAGVGYDRAASYWDLWLKEADLAITGTYPAAWIRQAHAPWLSGVMMICYLAYYVSPLIAVLPQVLKRNWRMVRRMAAVFAGALMTTYIGYILIPATGPRFEGGMAAWHPEQPGWFATPWWQVVIDDAEVIRWDAFPSGHVAIALVALVLALRHHRKVGLFYAPFVAGLVVATVYFGYHYVTDVLAGFLFAAFAFVVIEPAAKWWESIWPVPGK